MRESKSVIGGTTGGADSHPTALPGGDFGWYLLGWAGLVFVLVGGLDLSLAWYPLQLGDPEWEFGTISATLDRLPLATVGATFVLAASVARGVSWLVRVMAVLLIVGAVLIAAMAVVYATDVPMALNSAPTSAVRLGLTRAVIKGAGQGILYPIAYVGLAIQSWRHISRR